MPNCGNGICEMGEAAGINGEHQCPEDCSFSFTECKTGSMNDTVDNPRSPCSGNGTVAISVSFPRKSFPLGLCLFADGSCECFEGYKGLACDECAHGYYIFGGLCHPRQLAYRSERRVAADEDNISVDQSNEEIPNVHSSSTYVAAVAVML